jgi:hypothetical protein
LIFFLVSSDPAVAVAVMVSPANTDGGLAWHARVTTGGFLHPSAMNAMDADAKIRQADFVFCEYMSNSSLSCNCVTHFIG